MDQHLKTGATGEELACRYLERHGYSILERNWRHQHREIDIIAQWGETLVIAEVKTRGVTGVEMEALHAVSVALLTIYDMCKALDKRMEITALHLDAKSGGKSGDFRR